MSDGQMPIYKRGEFIGSADAAECRHPNLQSTGDTCSQGCCDYYFCPDCNKRIRVEVED